MTAHRCNSCTAGQQRGGPLVVQICIAVPIYRIGCPGPVSDQIVMIESGCGIDFVDDPPAVLQWRRQRRGDDVDTCQLKVKRGYQAFTQLYDRGMNPDVPGGSPGRSSD